MKLFSSSFLLLAAVVSFAQSANAAKFLGISIGCDKEVRFSYCEGTRLKSSARRATARAVKETMQHSGTSYFGKGRCEDKQLSADTPLTECILSQDSSIELREHLAKEWFSDKSIHCMPNSDALNAQAYRLASDVPRFDPYTGKERSLTMGEYTSLLQRAAEMDCERQ